MPTRKGGEKLRGIERHVDESTCGVCEAKSLAGSKEILWCREKKTFATLLCSECASTICICLTCAHFRAYYGEDEEGMPETVILCGKVAPPVPVLDNVGCEEWEQERIFPEKEVLRVMRQGNTGPPHIMDVPEGGLPWLKDT